VPVQLAPVLSVELAEQERQLGLEPEAPPQVRALPLGLVQVRVPEQQPREREGPQRAQLRAAESLRLAPQ
jgi:hypothetical protein